MRRVELESGAAIERRFPPGWVGGEVSVVPLTPEANGDDHDSVLMTFVTEADSGRSELWILSASTLETVARLAIPARVPVGFHSCWAPA